MSLHLPNHLFDSQAKIKVVGIGGAGSNALNRMIECGLSGVEFIAMNTDAQALGQSLASKRMQLGHDLTKGLGAGGDPDVGARAAKESEHDINAELEGADMVFITAGMGGGTGTGAAPFIAELARRQGILTVGVVTKPFIFEGPKRKRLANEGAAKLMHHVDTLITVPNDRLIQFVEKRSTMQEAFSAADDVLRQGVQGISDIILLPGLINVDFADVRSVMSNAGVALMGLGVGYGDDRALMAAQKAANSPLLETQIFGAKRLLINVTAGADFSIGEAHEAMEYILQFADTDEADIIIGHVLKEQDNNGVQITLLAAGMDPDQPQVKRDVEVFPKKDTAIVETNAPEASAPSPQLTLPKPEEIDEIDLDIPTFLRRQRGE